MPDELNLNQPNELETEADEETTTDETVVETAPAEASAEAAPVVTTEAAPTKRVFKIGGTTIHEDESTANLTAEQARNVLKAMYPEVANATIRETTANGVLTVEFLAQPGRKG